MKTVLFLAEYFKPHIGGAEVLFDNLIAGLVKAGYQVIVLTSRYTTTLPRHEVYQYGEQIVEVYRVGHNRYDFMRFALWKGLSLLKLYKINFIQTTTFNAAIPSALIRLVTRTPTVLHVHEIYQSLWKKFLGWKGIFYRWFEGLIFKFAFDHYTCSSLYTMNSLRLQYGIPDGQLTVTYCGIDYSVWDATKIHQDTVEGLRKQYGLEDAVVGLYFGRPGVAKGLCDYLRAIPDLKKKIPYFKAFLIVSKHEKSSTGIIQSTIPNQEVTSLIDELDISEEVIRIDGVAYSDLKKYIMMADMIVLPTMAEGFGLAIAEVCALGKSLVTTAVGSVPEVACGKVIFVRPGDPTDIARGVEEIYYHDIPSLPIKKYTWESCVKKFISVYQTLEGK